MEGFLLNLANNEGQSLVDLVKKEAQYLCCFNSHVENFEQEKRKLAAKHGDMKKKIKKARGVFSFKSEALDWKREADDIINIDTRTKEKCCFDLCPNCWWQYWRGKELAKKTECIKGLLGRSNTNIVAGQAYLPCKEYFSSQEFIHFKSRESKFLGLMKALEDDSYNMVGLQGMGGTGKTYMAKEVSSELEGSRFDKVFLLEVSAPPNFKMLRHKLAEYLDLKEGKEEHSIWFRLINMEEKLLIILDDVWEAFDVKHDLGIPYIHEHKGCSLLITTRSVSVCETMGCQIRIDLDTLNDEDALDLFQKHVGNINASRGLKGLPQKIVKHCGGLPVAIAAISEALKNQFTPVWKDTLKSLTDCPGDQIFTKACKCLELSYYNLKEKRAKELFLISSLFPKGSKIAEQLLRIIGIGLGSFCDNSKYHSTRNEVVATIMELKDSTLLLNDGGQFVKMHDLVHEVALQIRGRDFQVIMDSTTPIKDNIRYLFWKNDDFPDEFDGKELELLLIFLDDLEDLKVSDEFFMEMTELKVLILVSTCNYRISAPSLLHSLQSLTNIQTLTLKKLKLGDISILENLSSLVTLSLHYCSIDKLPKEFSKLKKLGLLELEMCKIKMNNPFEVIERCSQLEELTFVGNKCGKEEKEAIYQNESSLSLHRYQISYESLSNYHDKHGSISKCFRLDDSRHLLSEATFKQLVGATELLIFEGRYEEARWKNLIPSIVSLDDGGMNELMILHSSSCPDIECLIDNKNHSSDVIAFPNLVELHLYEMDVEDLYQGPMPSGFLEQLKIMKLKECQKLKSVLFNGNFNLCCLKSMELEDCPMLTSIFQQSTAQTLGQLEELRIKDCKALECVMTYKCLGGEIADDGDYDKKCYGSLFPNLKHLQITGCDQMEIVLPTLFAEGLPSLEEISICGCKQLKHIFDGNLNLCCLKSMELEDCPMLTSIFQQSTAQTLKQLEELRIKNCKALKYLMTYKSSGGEIVDDGDHDQECHGSLFPKLKTLQITGCDQLKIVLPILFAEGLPSLEEISICECKQLKYIFDKFVKEDHDMLPSLEEVELSVVPSLIGIYKRYQPLMASSMQKPPSPLSRDNSKQILRCPGTCSFSWAQTCFLNNSRTTNEEKLLDRTIQQGLSASKKWINAVDILKGLNFHLIKKLKIVDLSLKSASLFTFSMASVALWEELTIGKCIGLKHLISSKAYDSKDQIDRSSIFLKLEKLEIWECKELEFLFPFTASVGIENLKSLTIKGAPELKYVIGKHHDDPLLNQKNVMLHFYLPALEFLYFEHAPKMISICFMNFILALPSHVNLENCGIKSVTKLMVCSNEEHLNQEATKEIQASTDGVPLFQVARDLMARTLKNVKKMELQNCSELTSVLTLQVASTILLENLIIQRCHQLKCIVAEEGDAQVPINQYSIFPKLTNLEISDCKVLEFLFPATLSVELKNLKSLTVRKARQLKYVIGKHQQEDHLSNQNQNVELHFDLPSLQSLYLRDVPNLVNLCPENYCLRGLSLENIGLERSPNFSIRSITDFMVCDNARQQNSIAKEAIEMHLRTLESLIIENSKIEDIFNLINLNIKENENRLEPLASSLQSLSLEGLSELRNICVGPKQVLRLNKLSNLEIKECSKLEVVFSSSTLRSLPKLQTLKISDCEELVHIIEEDNKGSVRDDLHHEPCFPNLFELTVERCRKLKYLFSITVSGILPKLSKLYIEEASNLKHILIRQETKEMVMKDVLPELGDLRLDKLQSLVSVCHGIDFERLGECSRVHDCPKFSFHGIHSHIQIENYYVRLDNITRKIVLVETTITQLQDGSKNLDSEVEPETQQFTIGSPNVSRVTKEATAEIVEDVAPNLAKVFLMTSKEVECSSILEAHNSKKTGTTNQLTEPKIVEERVEEGASSGTLHPSYLKEVPIPMSSNLTILPIGDITNTSIRILEEDEQGEEEEGEPSMPLASNISRELTSETILPLGTKATSLKQTPLSIGSETSYGEHAKHEAAEIMPSFNETSNALQEIVDMMKLEHVEASILAEAFKTHPQLCLPMDDRSTQLLCVSYRVLLDILNILASRTPFTITEEDKKSLVENLRDALVLGFDKDWLESVKAKVFNCDVSGVHHMQQVLNSLVDKLETNKTELAIVCDQEDEATKRVEAVQKELDAVRARHYQLSKECQDIQKQRDQCWETISTKFRRFDF